MSLRRFHIVALSELLRAQDVSACGQIAPARGMRRGQRRGLLGIGLQSSGTWRHYQQVLRLQVAMIR